MKRFQAGLYGKRIFPSSSINQDETEIRICLSDQTNWCDPRVDGIFHFAPFSRFIKITRWKIYRLSFRCHLVRPDHFSDSSNDKFHIIRPLADWLPATPSASNAAGLSIVNAPHARKVSHQLFGADWLFRPVGRAARQEKWASISMLVNKLTEPRP